MIKVLLNGLIVTTKHTGYTTVILNYLKAFSLFSKNYNTDIEIIVVLQQRAFNKFFKDYKWSNNIKFIIKKDMDLKNRIFFEQFCLNKIAKDNNIDIIHSPATLGIIKPNKPQLLFFHASTTFMLDRKMHGRGFLPTLLINYIIKKSALDKNTIVATTTNVTANELKNYLKKDIITYTIYNGVPIIDENYNINLIRDEIVSLKQKKYFLYVSSFYKLKNQEYLIKFAQFFPNYEFILVGNPIQKDYFNYCKKISESIKNVKILNGVNFDELKHLYKYAYLYINPTLFEGFSLTPLEALKFKVPILLSNIEVLKEVYGETFLYFDPNDVNNGKIILEKLLLNYDKYKEINEIEAKNLFEKYSWDNFLKKNIELYKRIINEKYYNYRHKFLSRR